MASYEWNYLKKEKVQKFKQCPRYEVSNHPLKQNEVKKSLQANVLHPDFAGPNELNSVFGTDDPLLMFAQESLKAEKYDLVEETQQIDLYKSWNTKKNSILHKYTTMEKLSIISSYLHNDEKLAVKQVSNLNEQVKHRLEQLDYFDESSMKKTVGLTQQEFMTKINILNDELKKAWNEEQRVKAFKIAIQCSKLLSDTSVMQFYPSKFILICDILDTFGDLVYNRLKEKCLEEMKSVPQVINPEIVPESAKETCQNWLYKMASIRELLPRLYIEMTLLRCYTFISNDMFDSTISRLAMMIRGIGNPLVAVYLRVYLCRVASRVPVKQNDYFYRNLKEFQLVHKQLYINPYKRDYERQSLGLDTYLQLYIPALDWLLFGALTNQSNKALFEEFFNWCNVTPNSELFLCAIVSSFDASTVVDKTLNILDLIQAHEEDMGSYGLQKSIGPLMSFGPLNTSSRKMMKKNIYGCSGHIERWTKKVYMAEVKAVLVLTHEILLLLGEHLCKVDSCRQLSAESLIKIWWKIVSNLKSPNNFLLVLEPWLEFACVRLTTKHVNFILRGTIKQIIKSGKPVDECTNLLQSVVKRTVKSVPYVEEIFLMDAFMPIVELVQTASARTAMAKTILSVFYDKFNTSNYIMDHIVISGLMRLCCVMHESITAITVDDELKLIGDLISRFVQSIQLEDDLEGQLSLYVECRSAFIKLDGVLVTLVYAVNSLAVRAQNSWLQRACSAYCFVTVPSLHCPITKGQLYILSGQVALQNNCIGQAEAFFKAFVGLIPNMPLKQLEDGQMKCTQTKVTALFSDFLSTLLILPDNVDSNCKCYILNGFLKSMEMLPWAKTDSIYYTALLLSLDLLGNMSQENYIYHIDSVISNDMLYGSDVDFCQAINNYATTICEELLVVLKNLGDTKQQYKQCYVTLELLWRVVKRSDLQIPSMASLATKLWTLSQKLPTNNTKLRDNVLMGLGDDIQHKLRQCLKNGDKSI